MGSIQKPSIPKGTRDFTPSEMARRNYIFETIKSVFRRFGYSPIETPAMENLSTLLGKYGDEGDKLLFKILNSGEAFKEVDPTKLSNSNALSLEVCEKGLRYDLTVPFARFVVQHRNDITFPFKRYQIQPVWRADRPQKGRYREFYQCDVDVIGSKSLLNELELVQIADEVFSKLGINVCIKINNRKVLAGLAEVMGFPDRLTAITVAMDKIDKIGLPAVREEMLSSGVDERGFSILEPLLTFVGGTSEKIEMLRGVLNGSQTGMEGIGELTELFSLMEHISLRQRVELDLSLARGLNYYTGAIFEVKALDFEIGSICGGGRYDNLTGIFGLPDVSGVGISFGADRIYDVLSGLDKFPKGALEGVTVLFSNMDNDSATYLLPIVSNLRASGICCEIYPEPVRLKKQIEYADKNGIPYFVIAGESEVAEGILSIKELATGQQVKVVASEINAYFLKR